MTNLVHARYEIGQFCAEVAYSPAGKQQLFSLFLVFLFVSFSYNRQSEDTGLQKHYTILSTKQH